jgi:hypothetical protein
MADHLGLIDRLRDIEEHEAADRLEAYRKLLDEAVELIAKTVFQYEPIWAQEMSPSLLSRVKEAQENG